MNLNFSVIIILILVAIGLFIAYKIMKKFKVPKVGAMCMVTGGVKTGKSTFAVYLVLKNFKRIERQVKMKNFFKKAFGMPLDELPLLYSNIPLGVPYSPLTEDLLLRKNRFRYGSCIYVNEASLLADSQLLKNMEINERLMLFNKLIGHETKGGMIIYDTQAICDCHYSVKRCLSEYFYIHHLVKWIPFFMVAYVREDRYSEDKSIVSVNTEDVENSLRRVIIPKSTWKKFDSYCFSSMTDSLPVACDVVYPEKGSSLKVRNFVSFREFKTFDKENLNNEKKDN